MTARKPSGWLYVIGIVVFFGSCAGSFSHPLLSSSGNVESMSRFVMPGNHEVSLEAGTHYL